MAVGDRNRQIPRNGDRASPIGESRLGLAVSPPTLSQDFPVETRFRGVLHPGGDSLYSGGIFSTRRRDIVHIHRSSDIEIVLSRERAFLGAQVAGYRGVLSLCAVLMVVQGAAALAIPWLVGNLVSTLDASAPATLPLGIVFPTLLGLVFVQAVLGFGYGYLLASTQESVAARLRVRVHDHLQSLSMKYHGETSTGDYLTLLGDDVASFVGCITGILVPAIPMLITAAFALFMMWQVDGLLVALATLSVPIFFLFARFLNRGTRASADELTWAQIAMFSRAEEHLRLIPLIKAYGRELTTSRAFRDHARAVKRSGQRQSFLLNRTEPLLRFLAISGLVCLLWIGSRMAVDGRLSMGELASFFLYGAIFARTLSSVASLHGQMQRARVAVGRLIEILGSEGERTGGITAIRRSRGAIEYRDVSFAYPNREALFTTFNFAIRAGETVAITGPNGAGKSTLLNLLLRFHEPSGGAILLDDIDISRIRLACLREQIAWVPQSTFLFDGTIYENIAFGDPRKSRKQVEAAAYAAQADTFIRALPQGYRTVVGREAARLSGGQKQRIARARALLRDAPILALDEATVMFDPRAEARFLDENRDYLAQRTVVIITHHQENLDRADRVIELDDGSVNVVAPITFDTVLTAAAR